MSDDDETKVERPAKRIKVSAPSIAITLAPIARPLANEKLTKKLLKMCKKG